ncbi:MAG: CDF family Co(II)/Ni(II) efflux transporter DmeF [Proteobacteria bacterium]|nr:CDF family Co(II)/Ni(II) efflux transporter DmeF [Pseudomonadota bacterium]
MIPSDPAPYHDLGHRHVFLGENHEKNERRTWTVIYLCGFMMFAEIMGGHFFGSLALIADGLHMSTHAAALLIAALAYSYSRRHAEDTRFVFGTGKMGDLAGFTSAIVLALIAVLIGYEAIGRFLHPIPIHFNEAIPIAIMGLIVNLTSAWLLKGTPHHHDHGHTHHPAPAAHPAFSTPFGLMRLEIFEEGVPPRFRLYAHGSSVLPDTAFVEIQRPDGQQHQFALQDKGDYLESTHSIPEPHEFKAILHLGAFEHQSIFEEPNHNHPHGPSTPTPLAAHRDNNMYAAYIHVLADAAVSVLVIFGLILARTFGWLWMDPLVGLIGALVITNWAYGLLRYTGSILLDMNPDPALSQTIRDTVETEGDEIVDLHLWRLGPGHMGAIVSILTHRHHDVHFYHDRLDSLPPLSHVTIEIRTGRL